MGLGKNRQTDKLRIEKLKCRFAAEQHDYVLTDHSIESQAFGNLRAKGPLAQLEVS